MLRTVNYTLSPTESNPKDLQFAGVQGENNATVCVFTPDSDFAAALTAVSAEYDHLLVRVDCIDGLNRPIIGTPQTYTSGAVSFPLAAEVTKAGGTLKITLCFSGETVGEESTVLYTFPVQLYFENFPLHEDLTARENLNKAVLTCQNLRAETYLIAQSAMETADEIRVMTLAAGQAQTVCEEAAGLCEDAKTTALEKAQVCTTAAAHADTVSAAIDTAAAAVEADAAAVHTDREQVALATNIAIQKSQVAEESATSAGIAAAGANTAGQSALRSAASAQESATSASASASIASSAASSATGSAAQCSYLAQTASTAASNAALARDEVLAVVGNINSVLATVVNG